LSISSESSEVGSVVIRLLLASWFAIAPLHPLWAQVADTPGNAANAGNAKSPDADAVRVGDRYTFNTKNEITGEAMDTYVVLVTEISDKEIVTAISFPGKTGSRIVVLDHDLNRLDDSVSKYSPNDAQGIRRPLAVGEEWHYEYDVRNMQTGVARRASGVSKVVSQETVTTPAGTFDTFKIERHVATHQTVDQTRSSDTEVMIWYAPKVNRWVRRTFAVRSEGRLRSSTSEELVDFSRKM
jgi:hypothetical protein